MPTLDASIRDREAALFVGRAHELDAFRQWMGTDTGLPEVLNVYGHGGVGKSALLHAFARAARALGRTAVLVDSRDFPHTPEGLLAALAFEPGTDVMAELNRARALLLFDTFEELGALTRYLQNEFLPSLAADIKVVAASRQPLGQMWTQESAWRKIVRLMPLDSLSPAETREYLIRRGIRDDALIDQVTTATGGNPLALSLAADMIQQLGLRDLVLAPQWHLVMRSLAEYLLRDVREPALPSLLESCAVVRQFDEETLAAVSGQPNVSAAFRQVCNLSVIAPLEHGLTLHEDVRRILADDLRWRAPERYHTMRRRALDYYRERMRSASSEEREWLMAERMFLWDNELIQAIHFQEEEPGQVWLEPGRPEDRDEVLELYRVWRTTDIGGEPPPELERDLEMILEYPGTRLRIARDRDGHAVGCSTVVPVCQESLPIFEASPTTQPVAQSFWSGAARERLPLGPDSNIWFVRYIAWIGPFLKAARAALLRDVVGLSSRGGMYFVATVLPLYKAMAQALGFRLLPEVGNLAYGSAHPVDCYLLDLTRLGFETWIETLLSGQRPLTCFSPDEIARELQQVLEQWEDDTRLAHSPLGYAPGLPYLQSGKRERNGAPGMDAPRAAALRETIRAALVRAKERGDPPRREALRALEFFYFEKELNHQQAAKRLHASRATFYRWVDRGLRELSEQLLSVEAT